MGYILDSPIQIYTQCITPVLPSALQFHSAPYTLAPLCDRDQYNMCEDSLGREMPHNLCFLVFVEYIAPNLQMVLSCLLTFFVVTVISGVVG